MQTLKSIQDLIGDVKFNDWNFQVNTNPDGTPYVQIKFLAPGSFTNSDKLELQSCRKWQLSYHMCDEEIISTAYKAMLAAVEHEAREQFTWRGQAIYRPHYDIYALHELSSRNAVDKREEQPQPDRFERSGYDTIGAKR